MSKRLANTFRSELMTAFIAIGVIPFLICSFAMVNIFVLQAENDGRKAADAILVDTVEALDDVMADMDTLSDRIAGNVKLSQALLMENEEEYLDRIYVELYEKTSKYRDYAEFELYDLQGNCKFSTKRGVNLKSAPTYWGVLNMAKEHPYALAVRGGGVTVDDNNTALTFARMIIPYDSAAGYFVIEISHEKFAGLLADCFGGRDGVLVLDKYLNTVFEGGTADGMNLQPEIRTRFLSGQDITEEYNDNTISFGKLKKEDFYVAVAKPEAITDALVDVMFKALWLMAAIILFASMVIANAFAKGFSKPITLMRENMREVRKGNLDVRMETGWKNEFEDLSNSFNHMTSELKEYMNLQVEQQKELNGTQIAMMQAQLNPHFLYNTLDTMKWVAKTNHVPELVTLVSKLSKILRASISKEQFVSLKSEMELVESYAEIQRIRFDGKFECTCEYPMELEDMMVPKLVVQPIVENAVIHGLEDAENGNIMVEAYVDTKESGKSVLVIEVSDDGRGITDEELEAISKGSGERKEGHIGVRNVARIIELNYGPEYGLTIKRGILKGTIVTMTFPLVRGYRE